MKHENRNNQMGVFGMVQIIFIVLKSIGLIEWSWLWVLSPTWIWILFVLSVMAIFLIINLIKKIFMK